VSSSLARCVPRRSGSMSSHKKTYVSSRSCTLDLEPLKDLLVGGPVEIVGHDESATIDTELSSTTAADRAETDDRLAPGM